MGGYIQRAWEVLTRRIDSMLFACALSIVGVGLVTLFSAADQSIARVTSQAMSLSFAIVLMWIFANIAPQTLARAAVPLYTVAVAMLIGVALFGVVVNGSRRWLNLGVARFQPSELMKIALPLMLAWYFQKFEGRIRWKDFVVAAILIARLLGASSIGGFSTSPVIVTTSSPSTSTGTRSWPLSSRTGARSSGSTSTHSTSMPSASSSPSVPRTVSAAAAWPNSRAERMRQCQLCSEYGMALIWTSRVAASM